MKDFYKYKEQIDDLIKIATPTEQDLKKVLGIISDDNDLAVHFYRGNANPGWLNILNESGQFNRLADADITNDFLAKMKAFYLVKVSDNKPKEVVNLISGLNVKDWLIQGILLQSLLAKPLEVVDEGCELIQTFFKTAGHIDWYNHGERPAKFMIAIANDHPDKAFEIAELLLKIEQQDGENNYLDKTKTHFKDHDYEDLIFKHYKKLWEIYPFRATKLLIDVFNNYLNGLESDDIGLEQGFYYTIERLDQIESGYGERSVKNIIQGIYEAGKTVIEKQPERINELFGYLQSLNKPVFERIEMYLLRFVPGDGQIERVNTIIGSKKYLGYIYSYEYRLLLRDRFENISDDAKKIFVNWIKEKQVPDDDMENFAEWFKKFNDRDYTEDDLRKYEDGLRASKLFLVRDKGEFEDLYEKYKASSGKSDEELAPKPRISEARWISGKEGAPTNAKDMFEMKPVEAIKYINNPSEWVIDKMGEWSFRSPEEAVSHMFEDVVKQKVDNYAALELEELQKLKPIFLERYFNGIYRVFREETVKKENILNVFGNSKAILENNINDIAYEWIFRLMLDIIEIVFNEEELKKDILPQSKDVIWHIIEKLTKYDDDKGKEASSSETDPHTECINCVPGKAFTLVVKFGLFCKNLDEKEYNKVWSDRIKENLTYVIDNVKIPKVRCVLGVYFPQIHWLENNLVEERIDDIFDTNDDKAWEDIWGSYLSWSRAYKSVFLFLAEKDKYAHAINVINADRKKPNFAKSIDEGLVQHLMIAYFNNWIEWDNVLLKQFFDKANPELRGEAADFLRTGFKSVIEEGDKTRIKEKGERLKKYWEKRIEEISKNPESHFGEAIEFVDWVEHTLIEPKKTLELTLRTLELTNGKLGRSRDEVNLVKGVCKIGRNNELLALKCMNKMMQGEPEWISLSLYREDLENFLDYIVSLSDDTENIKEIREEAIGLVNAYGRRQIDELRPYYDKLSKAK